MSFDLTCSGVYLVKPGSLGSSPFLFIQLGQTWVITTSNVRQQGKPLLELLSCKKVAPSVRIVRLLYAAIVGNVLSLGVDPVEVDGDGGPGGVVAVLPDDALGLVQVVVLRRPLPPVGQVPCRVKRPTLVVETMGNFVPDNLNQICALTTLLD